MLEKMGSSAEESSTTILSSTTGFSHDHHSNHHPLLSSSASIINPPPPSAKKKRNLPGNPGKYPEAEVIVLSPKTLMATNRFLCEICGKGFQRDQNLQLHRRGHNLPWKLKQRTSKEIRKRVYVCPEKSCVHHHPSRALGDLTGIKKHFCRKHGEKKWKCEKCAKRYAVQSDWKAHSKTCGTREYKCDCGTLFSRRDSFITHRAFCDALAEETARMTAASSITSFSSLSNYNLMGGQHHHHHNNIMNPHNFSSMFKPMISSSSTNEPQHQHHQQEEEEAELVLNNQHHQDRGGSLAFWMSQGLQPQHQHQHQQELVHVMPNGTTNNSHSIQQQQQQDHHQIQQLGGSITSGEMFGESCLVPCTSSNPQSDQHHHYDLSWPIVRLNNNNNAGGLMNTSSPLPMRNVKELGNDTDQLLNVPSLHQQTTTTSASMSATALLQKAAQIGATTSSDHHQSVHQTKLCGLYGTSTNSNGNNHSTSTSSPFGSLHELESLNTTHIDQLQQMQVMYPPLKRQRTFQSSSDQECGGGVGGQTRDFLGVGAVQAAALCHPSSINGWI
ncbi:Zinc finger protein MAGPIE [Linum grandiflorum]